MNHPSRRGRLRISLKQLMLIVTSSAFLMLGGILIHKIWLRRHVETVVPLLSLSVDALSPHRDWIVANHDDVILDILLDPRINCVIVTSEYRNRDAAIRVIQGLDNSPSLLARNLRTTDDELEILLERK